MGEVYKARDTRLNRIVAIKVSSEQFSERFEREAHAVAALNHSNVCTLHDVGPNYLVMEYIEGTPLKGPLPLHQVLKYARQICDALDAAHRKGIAHRDLKPANILVTKIGVKLLDFGLAKIRQSNNPPSDATLTMALTGKNEIVGTLYYMSPEQLQAQATGQEVDARSDIFSFGLVLHEMLTGKLAFVGSSPATVIAAIMERPAPSIGAVAPPALDRVLKRCLEKDPDNRWQSARDLKVELEWIAQAPSEVSTPPSSPRRRQPLPWIAVGVLAIVAACASRVAYRSTRPAARTHRWPQVLPGAKAILFTAESSTVGFDDAKIEVVTLAVHRRKTLQRGGTYGRYLAASGGKGYLIYVSRGTLFAVVFDPEKLETSGPPRPALQQVSYSTMFGSAKLSFSRTGTLVYRSREIDASRVVIQWMDADGKSQRASRSCAIASTIQRDDLA